MTDAMLRVSAATRRYGAVTALAGVDLQLDAGERVALLGPNGAGKTTLMRAIGGRGKLDRGDIRIHGHEPGSAAARHSTGVVPQHIALYPALTVRENLSVFGRFHGVAQSRIPERIQRALEWSHLEKRGDHAAGHLSGGMQRRLNIACGTLHEPSLLLLDEPLAGVDASSREHVYGMLNELKRRGVTILESTHQLDTVTGCDRVLIMKDGRVTASGTVQSLIDASRLTAHMCRITLDRKPEDLQLREGMSLQGTVVSGRVRSVADELSELLDQIKSAGLTVREVRIDPPQLEDVFSHFTGEESGQ